MPEHTKLHTFTQFSSPIHSLYTLCLCACVSVCVQFQTETFGESLLAANTKALPNLLPV